MIQALRRPSARLRLTALYGVLFLVAGAMLLGLTYLLVLKALPGAGTTFLGKGPNVIIPQTSPLPASFPGSLTAVQIAGQAQQQVLGTFLIESGVALVLMAMISVLLGWIVAGRVLAPVHQITATARRLSQETLHERIGLTGPDDEMKELADTFDAMLARLDAAFESQQRFVANASHELRTPLATQRALVDVNLADPAAGSAQLRATLEKIRDVTDESEHLIASLLALAKSERHLERQLQVDLATVTRGVLERMHPNGSALRVESALEPAVVAGDPALLQRMVGNLIDNATRYNVPGGWIKVVTSVADGRALVAVSNSGETIPQSAVSGLFVPFHRVDGNRRVDMGGAGLGLSIVRAIATAHHGQVDATPLGDGGLSVSVRLAIGGAASPNASTVNR